MENISTRHFRRLERKTNNKQKRCINKLLKDTNITCTDEPTKFIFIGNAGLNNGLTEEKALEIFMPFGHIKQILMEINKTYSFLEFSNLNDAQSAYEHINGKIKIDPKNNTPLYLAYAMSLPNTINPWINSASGLHLIENFIDKSQEEILLSLIESTSGTNSANLKHRQVKHFGYEFNYENNYVKKEPLNDPVPSQTEFLFKKLKNDFGIEMIPNQLTINCYNPGQGIPPHVDTHSIFGDTIISLSLGSGIVINFKNEKGARFCLYLPERSLLVMTGESRYAWTHGITPKHTDVIPSPSGLILKKREMRISFTFRRISQGPCHCPYQYFCDTAKLNSPTQELTQKIAENLEDVLVHKVYDQIADHFSETRQKSWPKVLEFVNSLPVASILIDIGCGNGKYLGQNPHIFELGCERSAKLLEICNKKQFSTFQGDCLRLPLRSNCADACISIAVLHHLSTQIRRMKAINEIIRVLRPGGRGLIYVWAKNQILQNQKSSYIKQDRKNRKITEDNSNKNMPNPIMDPQSYLSENDLLLKDIKKNERMALESLIKSFPVHTNRTNFHHQDLLIPWKLKERCQQESSQNIFMRYYHVFEENELEMMCQSVEQCKILNSYYDEGNWCIIIEKE